MALTRNHKAFNYAAQLFKEMNGGGLKLDDPALNNEIPVNSYAKVSTNLSVMNFVIKRTTGKNYEVALKSGDICKPFFKFSLDAKKKYEINLKEQWVAANAWTEMCSHSCTGKMNITIRP